MNFQFLGKKSSQVFLVLVLLHLLILINTRFTVWPEMILYPWLQTKGFLLYKDIINPYFPLLPTVLFLVFKFFGSSVLVLKVFTWVVILISDLLIFVSAEKISKSFSKAILAVLIWMILQMSLSGNALWFELAIVPFLIPALTIIFLDFQNRRKILVAGVLLAVAVLIKQNAAIFFLPAVLYLSYKKQFRNLFYLFVPGLILGFALLVYLMSFGILADFYFWAINLTLNYTSQPGFVSLPTKKQYLVILFPATIVIGLLIRKKIKIDAKIFWVLVVLCSLVFAFPRYEDFHLQVVVAVSGLVSVFASKRILAIYFLICLVLFGSSLNKNWHQSDRFVDSDTLRLSQKIQNFNSVYLLNSPDLAYFFARKTPPKPWATNFPWYFEQPGFEDKFIEGLDKNTDYIVIGDRLGGEKYALGNYIPEKLLNYIELRFEVMEKYEGFSIWRKK